MSSEQEWMQRALRLAENGYTPPNPMVGCVLVRAGEIVGEGFHPKAGEPHAEVFALRAAGDRARGATAYVTLEPCSHWGRTPPCADALIEAGVARVVVATKDADSRVNGKGIERLRNAGIVVDVGLEEFKARRLNEAFFYYQTKHLPFTTLKFAMTLDGKIAAFTGHSQWITAEPSRNFVHELRAKSGAVLTGIGTVLADDPALNSRIQPPPPRQPLRIVLDSKLQTPPNSRLVSLCAPECPILIVTAENADRECEELLTAKGVEVLRLPPNPDGRIPLPQLWERLAERQIISVMVEAGGNLNAALLEANLVQKVLGFVAPKIVGGKDAPSPVGGRGMERMSDAISLRGLTTEAIGEDLLISGYVVDMENRH